MSEICVPEIPQIDCLPAELCMQFGKFQPEKFKACIQRYGDPYPAATLKCSVKNECEVCVTIPERVAKCGPGRYFIQILDGCHECDIIEVDLVVECKVKEFSVTQALPLSESCDECR